MAPLGRRLDNKVPSIKKEARDLFNIATVI